MPVIIGEESREAFCLLKVMKAINFRNTKTEFCN